MWKMQTFSNEKELLDFTEAKFGQLKPLIIDAICGKGVTTFLFARQMEERGLVEWHGNQHGEAWVFARKKLEELPLSELISIYTTDQSKEVANEQNKARR